jgi:hypothetical protein
MVAAGNAVVTGWPTDPPAVADAVLDELARYENLLAQCPSAAAETPVQRTWRLKLEVDVTRLRRLSATAPGQFVFPDGEDHASTYAHQPVSLL